MKNLRSNLLDFLRDKNEIEKYVFKWLKEGKEEEIPILKFG